MVQSYPGRILLVDDDPDTRSIYQEVLEGAGFKVDFAADGQEGLVKISEGGYDLILLDIMMPKIDGISVLKHLQQKPPSVYNGPIVVLSALDHEQVIKTALSLGAKGFLPKANVNPQQVLDKVGEILQKSNNSSSSQ